MKKYIISLIVFLSFYAQADLTDFRVATWILQGASATTESKWNINVRQLISGENAVDILAVQEAGSPPSTAVDTGRVIPSQAFLSGSLSGTCLQIADHSKYIYIFLLLMPLVEGSILLWLAIGRPMKCLFFAR